MTLAEFKALIASIPAEYDGFEMSGYTDIGEIVGVELHLDRNLVWLSDDESGVNVKERS